jgi:hypothetical protein
MYLLDARIQVTELGTTQITLQEVLHHFLIDLLLHLLVLLVQLSQVCTLGQHLQAEELSPAVHSRIGLLLFLLKFDVEGHLHGGEESIEEVVDAVGGVGVLYIIRTVAYPRGNPLQRTHHALPLLHLLEHLAQLLNDQSIGVFLHKENSTCMQTYFMQ